MLIGIGIVTIGIVMVVVIVTIVSVMVVVIVFYHIVPVVEMMISTPNVVVQPLPIVSMMMVVGPNGQGGF